MKHPRRFVGLLAVAPLLMAMGWPSSGDGPSAEVTAGELTWSTASPLHLTPYLDGTRSATWSIDEALLDGAPASDIRYEVRADGVPICEVPAGAQLTCEGTVPDGGTRVLATTGTLTGFGEWATNLANINDAEVRGIVSAGTMHWAITDENRLVGAGGDWMYRPSEVQSDVDLLNGQLSAARRSVRALYATPYVRMVLVVDDLGAVHRVGPDATYDENLGALAGHDVVDIQFTYGSAAALTADGQVIEFGGGRSSAPLPTTGHVIKRVAVSAGCKIALDTAGAVYAWASDTGGSARCSTNLDRVDGSSVTDIQVTDGGYAQALTADGQVVSWGNDTNMAPLMADALADAGPIAKIFTHRWVDDYALALTVDGRLVQWGTNANLTANFDFAVDGHQGDFTNAWIFNDRAFAMTADHNVRQWDYSQGGSAGNGFNGEKLLSIVESGTVFGLYFAEVDSTPVIDVVARLGSSWVGSEGHSAEELTREKAAPSITIDTGGKMPTATGWYHDLLSVTVSASDETGVLKLLSDWLLGGTNEAIAVTPRDPAGWTVPLAEGANWISSRATDVLGASYGEYRVFYVDTVPPNFTLDPSGLSGSATDATSGVAQIALTYVNLDDSTCWDGDTWILGTACTVPPTDGHPDGTWKMTLPLTPGTSYAATGRAADIAGHVTTVSRTFEGT